MGVEPSEITEAIRRACNMINLAVRSGEGNNGKTGSGNEALNTALGFVKERIITFESTRLNGHSSDQICNEMMRVLQLIHPLKELRKRVQDVLGARGKNNRMAALEKLRSDAQRIGEANGRVLSADKGDAGLMRPGKRPCTECSKADEAAPPRPARRKTC